MAIGNTFGATALSSYGGFWIAFAITLTPGGFDIAASYGGDTPDFLNAFGFFLMVRLQINCRVNLLTSRQGWFIFTFLLLIGTLRSTVAFFFLFFTLDLAFLMLGIGYIHQVDGAPDVALIKAGGAFGILAAFAAWYNALAGILDRSNSFFLIPVVHFPWSDKGREARNKVNNDAARAV
jgi:succinate-acetate transporter protein